MHHEAWDSSLRVSQELARGGFDSQRQVHARGDEVDVVDAVDLLCSSDSSGLDYGEGACSTPRSSVNRQRLLLRQPAKARGEFPLSLEFFSEAAPRRA